MNTFKTIAAQGEITIRRIGGLPKDRKLPDGFTAMNPERGRFMPNGSMTRRR